MKNLQFMILVWNLVLALSAYSDEVFIWGKYYDIETATEFVPPANVMREWPEELFLLQNLRTIKIVSQYLTSIPDAIAKFSQLENLEISGGDIHTVSANIGDLSKLVGLRLDLINLRVLPKEFANLRSLKELNLCGENTKFPGSIVGHHTNPELMHLWPLIKKINLNFFYLNSRNIATENFPALFEGRPLIYR